MRLPGTRGQREARLLNDRDYSVGISLGTRLVHWAPDGKTIASRTSAVRPAIAQRRHRAWWTSPRQPFRPAVRTGAAEYAPLYAPDGRWIGYLATDDPPTWGLDAGSGWCHGRGHAAALAATFDRTPRLVGCQHGKRLYYAENQGTLIRLGALPAGGARRSRSARARDSGQ